MSCLSECADGGPVGIQFLEDRETEIEPVLEIIGHDSGLYARVTSSGYQAYQGLMGDPALKVFVVDLKIPQVETIKYAAEALLARPDLSCVALTYHFDEFDRELARMRAGSKDPFLKWYRKDEVLPTADTQARFVDDLRLLGETETFEGAVIAFDDDYGKIEVSGRDGRTFVRAAEREFLEMAGVERVGDEVDVIFRQNLESRGASVSMHVLRRGTPEEQCVAGPAKFIDERVNLSALRERLG